MKRMNRSDRKEQRRVEAKERQAAYDALTPGERLEKNCKAKGLTIVGDILTTGWPVIVEDEDLNAL